MAAGRMPRHSFPERPTPASERAYSALSARRRSVADRSPVAFPRAALAPEIDRRHSGAVPLDTRRG
jgi:hypothetical protein